MIAVIDYDMGNVGSILNMLRKIGAPAKLTSNPSDLNAANGLILPGVGAFDQGVRNLQAKDLLGPLEECVIGHKIPILGICLGMQLLTKNSEEGNLPGLGWIDARTRRFKFIDDSNRLRIPQMGWNYITPRRPVTTTNPPLSNRLFAEADPESKFYFVHSYHVDCADQNDVLATATYGYEFHAAIGRGNIAGTQFHPEKSLRYGLQLMRSFVNCVTTSEKPA